MKLADEALLRDVLTRMHRAVKSGRIAAGGPGSGRHKEDVPALSHGEMELHQGLMFLANKYCAVNLGAANYAHLANTDPKGLEQYFHEHIRPLIEKHDDVPSFHKDVLDKWRAETK